ncbi:MAG: DMT family transporter [candidate division Zixibacteria bacterium]|nr:DMT family transporter [candidate division Zixibacteria bacterium]
MLYWAMSYTGEIAALTTAVLWSFTSIFFTQAARRIGSYWLNKFRLVIAVLFLGTTLLITTGGLLPSNISPASYYYLIASGIVGLTLADSCLFHSFLLIGTRLTLLIFAVSPIIAALTAWPVLGEKIGLMGGLGIAITLSGVIWVTRERRINGNEQTTTSSAKRLGIMLALGAAACQAIGLVLAKAGMGNTLDPLPATFLRMISAAAAIWLYGLFRGDLKDFTKKCKDRRALLFAVGGAFCGPFLGVWMSLTAVKYTQAGIAMAIMATVPILIIPLVIVVFKEKVSPRAVIGAILAVIGVTVLFLA